MISLDELVKIDGVVLACDFNQEGATLDYRSGLGIEKETADQASQYIATITMMFNTLSDAFSRVSGMQWTPQRGWTYSGGAWTVIAGGNRALFVETAKADINQLMKTLGVSAVEGRIEQSL